ncbi:MAG: hypothetical protein FWF03_04375, partial [Defluviitaleaceae bacterium]|nr:hypothetical protein [Defluviitaleaceae bacterium]
MTDKQNALEIIRFGKPERVASRFPSHTLSYHGANHQGYGDAGMDDGHARPTGSVWEDVWGTVWMKEYPGVMGFPKRGPLHCPGALGTYAWPDANDERICARIYKSAEAFAQKDEKFLCGSHRDTLWEKSYMLAGMEGMMGYFYEEPECAREILARIMDFQLKIAAHYASVGIEMAILGDDLGTQRSLLLGMDIFDEFLRPEYARLFNFYKSRGILVSFHSCGHIEPLLESFVGLGVDVLNPVQATANDIARVICVTDNRMALEGGVSSGLVASGPVDKINEAVKHAIETLGPRGGYFCAPDQAIPF